MLKALSQKQRLGAGAVLLSLLAGVTLVLFEHWQWAAAIGLLLVSLVGWLALITLSVADRAAKRSLDSKRAAKRAEELTTQFSKRTDKAAKEASHSIEENIQRLRTQLREEVLPSLSSSSEYAKNSAEYSRKALTRLRDDLPELSASFEQVDRQFTYLEEQLTQSQKRVMNRVRADVSPISPALQSMEARIEQNERRLLGSYESERLAQQDRYEAFKKQITHLNKTVEAQCSSAEETNTQVKSILTANNQLEKSVEKVLASFSSEISSQAEKYDEQLTTQLESALAHSRDRLMNRVLVAVREETRQVEALMQLMPQIKPRAILPPSGRWAMDARALLHLSNLVQEGKPKNVLELGGGTSTVWLGYLCETYGGKVVSVDHEEKFATLTNENIQRHGLETTAEVRTAPLEDMVIDGQTYQWYETSAFEDLTEIDLLVVDGPPGTSGKDARLPALPHLIDRLASECLVVLDDAEREDEREVFEIWAQTFPGFKIFDNGVSRFGVLRREAARV